MLMNNARWLSERSGNPVATILAGGGGRKYGKEERPEIL